MLQNNLRGEMLFWKSRDEVFEINIQVEVFEINIQVAL